MKLTQRFSTVAALILLIAPIAGCHGLLSKSKTGSHRSASLQSFGDAGSAGFANAKNERELCVETAKTLVQGGHAHEAILLYEKAESLDPNDKKFDKEIAPLHASKGNLNKAIDRYRSALQNEKDSELLNNFIWTLVEANQLEEAAQHVNHALGQFPKHERLRSTLAVIEYKKGNPEGAFRVFESVMGTASAYHNLAVLEIDHGNAMEAKKYLQLAVSQSQEPNPLSVQMLNQLDELLSDEVSYEQVAARPARN